MTLIDLGEVGFQPPADPTPPPPRWLRRLGVPERGKASAVAALAVLAGALAGTAPDPGPPPPYRTVPAVSMSSATYWASDGVVVQLAQDARTLSAIDLGIGKVLWSAVWGQTIAQMDRSGTTTIMIQSAPNQPADPEPALDQEQYMRRMAEGSVTALDLRTGKQRWQHPGALLSQYDSPELVVLQAAAAEPTGWRLVRVDLADGHEMWSRPAPSGLRWSFTYDNDFVPVSGGLVLMDSHDGSVMSVGSDGRSTPRGRVAPGGLLEWAWSDYLAVSYPTAAMGPTDGPAASRFELHDLRTLTPHPLWTTIVDPMTGSSPWPCGVKDRLCMADGNTRKEVRARDGSFVGLHEELPGFDDTALPSSLGIWNVVGMTDQPGQALAVVSPAMSRTGVGWLGLVRVRDAKAQVTPLIPVPVQITACWLPDDVWIVCNGIQRDGREWDRSIVLRKSDVDDLARNLAGG